jgi:L-aminopeptidase/D-esterase-like protein
MTPLTNDHLTLTPRTTFNGRTLTFDWPAFHIGVAEYDEGPTGCTVFHFPNGAATAVDIRGGAPGTILNWEFNHAICLAGGSLYGLEATTGVAAELWARRNYSVDWEQFALVSGTIIYDYGERDNRIYPDKALGRAALQAARPGHFPLGARGAGRSATCGWFATEPSGQGGAFRQVGPTKVAVFVVVNCCGAIVNRQGQVVRGNLDPATGRRRPFVEVLEQNLAATPPPPAPIGNTTLTVAVTNQKLNRHALQQFGRQIHSSLARAIQPFHTLNDGDVLYAITTAEVENPALDDVSLGVIASELAWDAVLDSAPRPSFPSPSEGEG